MSEDVSEFGRGYAYCLGLFIAHEFRAAEYKQTAEKVHDVNMPSLWFNGAADHLFDLEIPEKLPPEKQKWIAEFKDRCLRFRLCMGDETCTWDDVYKALDEAKDLLREWDEFNGISTQKGKWQ